MGWLYTTEIWLLTCSLLFIARSKNLMWNGLPNNVDDMLRFSSLGNQWISPLLIFVYMQFIYVSFAIAIFMIVVLLIEHLLFNSLQHTVFYTYMDMYVHVCFHWPQASIWTATTNFSSPLAIRLKSMAHTMWALVTIIL